MQLPCRYRSGEQVTARQLAVVCSRRLAHTRMSLSHRHHQHPIQDQHRRWLCTARSAHNVATIQSLTACPPAFPGTQTPSCRPLTYISALFPSPSPSLHAKKRAFKLAIHQVFNPYALASSHAIAFRPSFLESLATSGLRPANGIQPTAAAHPGLLPGSGALPLACPSPPIDYSLHLLSQKKKTEQQNMAARAVRARVHGRSETRVIL